MKLYHIALLVITLVFTNPSFADSDNLPYCQENYCTKIFHNKALGKATAVVWKNKDEIIQTYSFDLDKNAKLSKVIDNGIKKPGGESYFSTYSDDIVTTPPSGCIDTCSRTVEYKTLTEIIKITYIFYLDANGNLIDVDTVEKRIPREDTRIIQ